MLNIFRRPFSPTKWRAIEEDPTDGLRIRAVDEDGQPVEGAFVGNIMSGKYRNEDLHDNMPADTRLGGIRVSLPDGSYTVLRFISRSPPPRSGSDGVMDIPRESLTVATTQWQPGRPEVLCIVHPERCIGGLACCRAKNLGSFVQMTLRPLCYVHGTVTRADGAFLPAVKTFAFWGPRRPWRLFPAEQGSRVSEIGMLLPPESYLLQSCLLVGTPDGVTKSLEDWRKISIAPGTTKMRVDMKLAFAKRLPKIIPCGCPDQKAPVISPNATGSP